jgi:riboflavin kinase/FMN adenylyltransferase
MEVILGIDRLKRPLRNPVVTLGNFDGVHLGHQRIFERVIKEASRYHGESVVITFEPHPLKVLAPERRPPLLSPFKKKMMLIEKSGIDVVICLEFSLDFSKVTPFDFVKDLLIERINARKIIIGYNYHFGRKQRGNAEILKKIGSLFNVKVEIVEALGISETVVSSSKIRELIKNGQVEEAGKLLGRNYPIIGKVVHGVGRGHTLGFPTVNLEMSDDLFPKPGVYAVEVQWNQQVFRGVANIGSNPTFPSLKEGQEGRLSLEVFILDFNQEIYGEEIQVGFKKRIRDEIRFDSAAQLVEQIRKDIQWAKENAF